MTKDERAKLRELTLRATPGPWVIHGIVQNGHQPITIGPSGARYILAEVTNAPALSDVLNGRHPQKQWDNAEFIAAVNPQTVLALLDELDRLEHLQK